MLLKGLPRAQLPLPVWTARKLVPVRQWASQLSDTESKGPSLFEELFPEESRKEKESPPTTGSFRNIARRVATPSELRKHINVENEPSSAQKRQTKKDQLEEIQNASVLVLSNASRSLVPSDFLRLSPKGKHIDGWTSGIIKVIPGRDPTTLEAQGHYFILFSTDAAARAYKERMEHLHRISQDYTPKSITSPLAPPPGWIKDGEELHALIQSFTLIPSSAHHLSLYKPKKPFSPGMQRVLEQGGPNAAVTALYKKCQNLVLLYFDRGYVRTRDLRALIGRDGKERNLQWALLPEKDNIVMLEGRKLQAQEGEDDADPELETVEDLEEKKTRKEWQPRRFVLSFRTNQEARRFVRAWHRRPFSFPTGVPNPGNEALSIANAELLW